MNGYEIITASNVVLGKTLGGDRGWGVGGIGGGGGGQ